MRHIKRFLAMLLSVLMFVSSIPVTAFADSQTETDLQEQKPPGLSLETELSEDGQTVTAMIKAGAYTNASALQFDLHFDAAKVSVTEENVTLGGLAQSMECLLSVNDGYLSVAGAVSSEETKTSTEEETILTAEFTVLEGAADDLLFSLSDLVYQGEEGIFQNADSQFGTTLSSAVTIPEPAREYMVTALPAENGNVTVSAESAAEGTEVGLTVNPDPEYRVRSLKVTYQDSDGTKEVAVTESNTFIMPAADVTVEAVFEGDSRLLSLEISEENGGINSYTLNPEFDKAGLEYELTIPDYLSYAYIRVQNKNVQDKIIAKYPTTFGFSYKTMTPDNWEYTQIGIKNLLTLKVGPDVSVSTFDSSVYPDVTTYAVKITRSATLTDLAMDGTVSPSKFDRSKTDYTAVIPGNAGTFKVTPKWNTSGYSVESGDLASDKPGEVLEFPVSWDSEGKMEIPVTVKAEGKLPTTYNITVFAEKHEDVPAVNANPEGGQSYIDTAAADKVTPLTVKASANGTLSYQWYQNTVDSNENGQIITGAAEDTYIPEITATDKTKITYYYCVVTNTNGGRGTGGF